MADAVQKKGGKIINGGVSNIETKDGCVKGVVVDGNLIDCDRVISTAAPHVLKKIIDPQLLGLDLNISYQGTACALFGLKEMLMDEVYWLNIKENVPFGAVIEHTNFIPLSDYGEHLVYVTSYFQNPNSLLWSLKDEDVIELYLKGLEKLFSGSREKVKWWRLRR
ncbi:MAG: FAD-dependent oxidoreductase, partial [Candidatus Methanoperedens sp.]|nr:FAD-dependent oxidoreductase [Candidatus Methanoperedens sp.]